jgi:hypothetical protein
MRPQLILIPIIVGAALAAGCARNPTESTRWSAPDNGIAALSATEILDRATTALSNVDAYRMIGAMLEDGEEVRIDYQYSRENFEARIQSEQFSFHYIKIGDLVYFQPPAEMIALFVGPAASESKLEELNGKYIKINADHPQLASFASVTDPKSVLAPVSAYTERRTKTIDGIPAIGLVDGEAGTLYIATVGEPLPLQMEARNGSIVNFEYDVAVEIQVPDAAQVVDLESLLTG